MGLASEGDSDAKANHKLLNELTALNQELAVPTPKNLVLINTLFSTYVTQWQNKRWPLVHRIIIRVSQVLKKCHSHESLWES